MKHQYYIVRDLVTNADVFFNYFRLTQMRHKCYQNYKGASTQSLICREGQTDGRTYCYFIKLDSRVF